jgi:stage V sporulation protein R
MPSVTNRSLPPRLEDLKTEIKGYAKEFGLDFYEVVFEMLTYDEVNMVAAYGGYPNRYPHWRFGMDYEQLSKGYEYGLSKIYEMVINNDPTYAYLLESNPEVDQKLVMAHVYGHGDFFKNNFAFRHTNRKMMDEMANHATRVRRWIDRIGIEPVEDFVDRCLSLENLIDYHAPYIKRGPARGPGPNDEQVVRGLKTEREYMRDFINPPDYLADLQRRLDEEKQRAKRFPEKPQRDVLAFLLEHAPLEPWEADVLAILREEAYYFAPQGMTKIMNEGWACLAADTPVFTERGLLTMAELVGGGAGSVCDGETVRRVYDRHVIRDHETVRVKTRRGFDVCGSNNHRVLLADRVTWKRLDELVPGDRLAVSGGRGLWPEDDAGVALPGRADPARPLPEEIRRAPRKAVAAYLRALFDAAGEIAGEELVLATPNETLAREVQLCLLNFAILCGREPHREGWRVRIGAASAAKRFAREIGFGLERKQEALEAYVAGHRWTEEERWEDEVVATEAGRADVYDISVEETHRYAAGGLVNHNSFWHSKIMTTRALKDSEIVDYADHHSGTVSMRPGSLNPYKIGIELYRDIEDRWNRGRFGKEWEECDDLRTRQTWDRQLGLGRQKIFEVRRHYTDVTFIDEFLTPEFCLEHKLFVYGYNDKHQAWEILSRDFKAIKEKLLHQLTNFGQPIIEVVDGNFENRGELLLVHRHDGVDLRMDHARESLRNLQSLWRRPVNLHTRVDGKGLRIGFDGREFLEKRHEL